LPSLGALLRTLRHPDVSVVVDLSHLSQAEKVEYVSAQLPALTTHRRHTGLPHRILIDEAHYFLHDAAGPDLLDPELNGYTLVSYRASRLHPSVLSSAQAILVTRESDPDEVRALTDLCRNCAGIRTPDEWESLLGGLHVGEAVLLPVADEAHGAAQRIQLAARITPHVRHVSKYIDIPIPDSKAFVFSKDGCPTGQRARTLRQVAELLDTSRPEDIHGHLQRSDLSRWIEQVFGDHKLAGAIRQIEENHQRHPQPRTASSMANEIRRRYQFSEPATSRA
jgi:hypothetical protein